MTVKELKDFLEECDDDMEVTILAFDVWGPWEAPADCEIREDDGEKSVCIRVKQENM